LNKVTFVFGIHNHQPVGNFDFVFEDAYQRAYLPFLEVLEAHPKIRLAQHYSGILFEWILRHHPDYINRLRQLVERQQVEMMTGAYYEPILMTIPDRDQKGQILKLTKTIEQHTGYKAQGLWLAERVWEPHLPKPLREAGIIYTIVDDSHFKYAGLKENQLTGYYVTEEQGVPLNIFPISERLRYTIPFGEPEETLEYIQKVANLGENRIAIFADDGEKFGVWPTTYEHVFKRGWLDRFFQMLEENSDWIAMRHFSEVIAEIPPVGQVYLPTASYREMMEWALPAESNQELEDFQQKLKQLDLWEKYSIYVRGGFWRNFLVKYPESNQMHKKMLYVSNKVWKAAKRLPPEQNQKALDHLWAGQCNCPYWHGVFGGLYLPHLRHAIYQNLIQAETIVEKLISDKNNFIRTSVFDLTGNGKNDIVIETSCFNLYFEPHHGAQLFEWDYKPRAVNLLDTMTRRQEGYHRQLHRAVNVNSQAKNEKTASIHDLVLAKEDGLERYLNYDWYQRNALIDHFLANDAQLENFARCQYEEKGDFVNQPYAFKIHKKNTQHVLEFERLGRVWDNDKCISIGLRKKIVVNANSNLIEIHYEIQNQGNVTAKLNFGIEWNFGLLGGHSPDRYYEIPGIKLAENYLASTGEIPEVGTLWIKDHWLKLAVKLTFSPQATLWRFPIETVSLSEGGFERVYQNSTVLPHWQFILKPGEYKQFKINNQVIDL